MIFLLDHFFQNDAALKARIPMQGNDMLIDADVTHEPKTTYIDELSQKLKDKFGTVSGVIGIGGGSVMDLAKAVSIMMTNPGKPPPPFIAHAHARSSKRAGALRALARLGSGESNCPTAAACSCLRNGKHGAT